MPLLDLPQELIQAILGILNAQLESKSLRACSMTCKALCTPAQALIFELLYIDSPLNAKEKSSALEKRPHIRPFVKHLVAFEMFKPWIQKTQDATRVFEMVGPHVTTLDLFQRRSTYELPRFDYPSLSQLKRLEVIRIVEETGGIDFGRAVEDDKALPNLLDKFPNLHTIAFDKCLVINLIDNQEASISLPPPVFKLDALIINGCADILALEWLVPAVGSLRKLRVSTRTLKLELYTPIIEKYLATSSVSLEHLDFQDINSLPKEAMRSVMAVIKTHNTNLRSLRLEISDLDSIEVVNQCLQVIETRSYLSLLTIGFDQRVIPNHADCVELENLLFGGGFPNLKNVHIQSIVRSGPTATDVEEEALFAAFPQLAKRRMLSVSLDARD